MIRRIIEIDKKKCNGCGLCASVCHEGAIEMVNGKARLMRDDYCDGLGDCLPACPTGAISFVEREAAAYNEAAVKEHMARRAVSQITETLEFHKKEELPPHQKGNLPCGCPGTNAKSLIPKVPSSANVPVAVPSVSQLRQWPVQIKLAPENAPYFEGARLLVAADCTAYAYARFHDDFIRGKVALIGCPKLDDIDYSEKLTRIIKNNDITSVTIVRMEVPCCGGIENAAKKALKDSGKFIPWQVVTISIDGKILD